MKKLPVTRKRMRELYAAAPIISIGYCRAQYLLQHEQAKAYSHGYLGWACDYYDIGGVLISTGYRPLAAKRSHATPQMIADFERRARAIDAMDEPREERAALTRDLLDEFIAAATR